MKIPLVLITSIIHINKLSIYTPEERYKQTLKTIESVQKNIPNAKIVILEASEYHDHLTNFNNTIVYNVKQSHIVSRIPKSCGEVMILREFLESDLFRELRPLIDRIFKVSGRYIIKDSFILDNFSFNKITVRRIYIPHSKNSDHSAVITLLFSFPENLTEFIIERLHKNISKMYV